jgi:hypothetical protein
MGERFLHFQLRQDSIVEVIAIESISRSYVERLADVRLEDTVQTWSLDVVCFGL